MPMTEKEYREVICEIGRLVFQKGWVAANDGNISIKLSSNRLLATPTAICKGMMKPDDLIICDFCLPGMNGLSFLKLVKKMRRDMRVILLTGYPSQELEAQVIHHGSCTYLSKTVDAPTLCRIVKEALCPYEPAILF